MIHYIVLMEERAFQKDVYHTLHFYKKGEGNEIPIFREPILDFGQCILALGDSGYKKQNALSIEEIILNDVGKITVFFYREDGSFDRTGIYRRVLA